VQSVQRYVQKKVRDLKGGGGSRLKQRNKDSLKERSLRPDLDRRPGKTKRETALSA